MKSSTQDRGTILPMVLVVTVVLGLVVVAVANNTATVLRYGQVSEDRAGRIAAAQGAMDDAIEQLELRSSLCATAGGGSGIDVPFPEEVNGASVVVSCRIVGGTVPPSDGWAIVITGEGAPADSSSIFEFSLGGNPEISGPVFLSAPERSEFSKTTTMVEGDIWYPDDDCATSVPEDDGVQFARSTLTIYNVDFDPTTRGIYCVNREWDELFGTNLTISSAVNAYATDSDFLNRPFTPIGSCRVFDPGYYTSLPLGGNNYFRSGEYVFADLGLVELQGQKVTMGQTAQEQYPAVDNSACDPVRLTDPDTGGATLYISGNTQFISRANSGFEVSGRQQGSAFVAIHVLNSSLGYGNPLFNADNGAQKEVAIQGLLWAPTNSLQFDTIPTQKAAVLRGGAVVASFIGGVSAAAIGFVIEVPTSKSSTRLLIESKAMDGRGENTVRSVADYRPSTGEVAVASRRVVD